jgi:N-acetylglucosaminyldiphosphoundecaprenol N-acetyl-beta-D-mannosaminyltransferase
MQATGSRVNLLNTWIDKIDLGEAAQRIDEFARSGAPHQVVTVNLDFLRLAARDHSFRELINSSSLVVADGMPLVWGARLNGDSVPERIAGVDLVCECAKLSAEHGYRMFFLGAAPGVAERAANVLRERFPGVSIVGTHAPPKLSGDDERAALALIRSATPDILLVAFGAPRQEQWIRRNMHMLGVPVCMGVGGAFDILSGRISRAPRWMQRAGLEWFHRFLREPGRLWKRYFVHDLPVFLHLLFWIAAAAATNASLTPAGPATVGSEESVRAPALASADTEPQGTITPATPLL